MAKIRVGLAGFGLSGRIFHLPLVQGNPEFEVAGVLSTQREVISSLLPHVNVAENIDELCAAEVDLIVVGVPNYLHLDYATKALNAGKHVVVEKPFTVNVKDANSLTELAAKKSKVLTVFHNRRWDSDFLTIQAILESGQLGEISHFEAHFDRFKPGVDSRWKEMDYPGGGVLFDLGAHLIDQALQLFGTPKRIFADIACHRPQAFQDDYFHLILDFGKTRAILHASALVANIGPRFVVHGSKGSYVKSGMDPQEDQLKSGIAPTEAIFGLEPPERFGTLTLASNERLHARRIPSERGSYQSFYNQLASAVKNGTPAPVSPEDATKVIRVIELARESAKSQRFLNY